MRGLRHSGGRAQPCAAGCLDNSCARYQARSNSQSTRTWCCLPISICHAQDAGVWGQGYGVGACRRLQSATRRIQIHRCPSAFMAPHALGAAWTAHRPVSRAAAGNPGRAAPAHQGPAPPKRSTQGQKPTGRPAWARSWARPQTAPAGRWQSPSRCAGPCHTRLSRFRGF